MSTERVFLSLGSNLGNRQVNLESVIAALESPQLRIIACSSIYETEPQDVTDQPWFLNRVVECRTEYHPLQLLARVQHVERDLGRTRVGVPPRGPRIIDIDILLFGEAALGTEALTIPHPRMMQRRFVLEPLLEIAPDLKHPLTGESLGRELPRLKGQTIKKQRAAASSNCPAQKLSDLNQ